jgi:aryl-alcohol dehydrogenase-like predicted oxidoreductase
MLGFGDWQEIHMIEHLFFGDTGHLSTRTIFGAAALGKVTQAEAGQTLETLLEYGVNHIDTAASYGNAEERIGPWMKHHREDFFLATKTGERTYEKAREQIRRSLERLQVDQLDLIQLHCLVDESEWEVTMGPGGALEAVIEARDEGLVRFIGVTGHGTTVAAMHLRSLERFAFDSVLLPYNYPMMQNPQYAADFEVLVSLCQSRKVAIQTIKAITRRPWGDQERTNATWYEPLREQPDIDVAVRWVLSRPGIFLNTVGDITILPKVLDAASRYSSGATMTAADSLETAASLKRLDLTPLFV